MTAPDTYDVVHEGSCLCGAVRFTLRGEPLHFNVCHCTMCQKFHGAMAGPYLRYSAADFTFVEGEEFEQEYVSSDWARRTFCRQCGSSLRYQYTPQPELTFIAAGVLDTELAQGPTQHIFVKDKCSWYAILDGRPQLRSWRDESHPEAGSGDGGS